MLLLLFIGTTLLYMFGVLSTLTASVALLVIFSLATASLLNGKRLHAQLVELYPSVRDSFDNWEQFYVSIKWSMTILTIFELSVIAFVASGFPYLLMAAVVVAIVKLYAYRDIARMLKESNHD